MNNELKGYVVRNVEFRNSITGEETMNLCSKVDSVVNYMETSSECVCKLSLDIRNVGNPELLVCKFTIEAVYSFNTGDNKQGIHNNVSKMTFTLGKAMVHALCGVVGIPLIMVPEVDFDRVQAVISNSQ